MSGRPNNVTHIRGRDSEPVEVCSFEDDLREFACQVENGECSAFRGVLVYQTRDGCIRHVAVGDAVTKVEAVGMLTWAADDAKR